MKQVQYQQELREMCFDSKVFPQGVLNWIKENNLWNLWVPKNYGGLELSLTEGLTKLKELARIDGSLGWTVTLCSGANYFIGNMDPETAQDIFLNTKKSVCMGGSGGVFGTAEAQGDHYIISGKWRYATGAPYLSHFTLNAKIFKNGNQSRNMDGSVEVLSFVVPREQVQIIYDWNTMGLKASATHSFEVKNIQVPSRFSFRYNEFYQPQDIFKIPFSVFADLTLWVNYIGMAEHFLVEATDILSTSQIANLKEVISVTNQQVHLLSSEIENLLKNNGDFSDAYVRTVHKTAARSVSDLTTEIIFAYPLLGIKACREDQQLNHIFKDYFTATQHHIFTKK